MSTDDTDWKEELPVLRERLDSFDLEHQKSAAKRVLDLMRSGEDVKGLFPNMIRCVNTTDLELKKIIYLYIVSYADEEQDLAILATSTFTKDAADPNPIVRALAVRTMCRIKAPAVAENMIVPLKTCLSDNSPYVRKTAAFGVAKLYDIIPEEVEGSQLFEGLLNLLRDDNPLVVSNAVASIFEINAKRATPILALTADTVIPMLSAITDCTEWCQVTLLDALATYVPESHAHAASLIDRLIPFLKNANPAVVIGAFKCIFVFMERDDREPAVLFPQIIPSLMTLLSSSTDQEIQYVVLRTLSLFVLKYPTALSKEITLFFCKYNDSSYVKMEKLDITMAICVKSSAKVVLDELSEYCNEVDVAFVKKSVKCVGQIALKFPNTAPACVDVLMRLVESKAEYAVEEAMVVLCDVLRKYPGKFESVIKPVCSSLDQIKEASARAAAFWILGEYCALINSVDTLLDPYLDTFHDEQPAVQAQLLTALVKVFLNDPESKDQLQFVLNEASKEDIAPDVRSMAVTYFRLLTQDLQLTRDVVIFSKSSVGPGTRKYTDAVLNELIRNMGAAAGVLHEIPEVFVVRKRFDPALAEMSLDAADLRVERHWEKLRVSRDADYVDLWADYDRETMYLRVENASSSVLKDLGLSVSKNSVGITLTGRARFPSQLEPDGSCEVSVPLKVDSEKCGRFRKTAMEIVLKTNYGTVNASGRIPLEAALMPTGKLSQEQFRKFYSTFPSEVGVVVEQASLLEERALEEKSVFVVGRNGPKIYVTFTLASNAVFVGELYQQGGNVFVGGAASEAELQPLIEQSARQLFCSP